MDSRSDTIPPEDKTEPRTHQRKHNGDQGYHTGERNESLSGHEIRKAERHTPPQGRSWNPSLRGLPRRQALPVSEPLWDRSLIKSVGEEEKRGGGMGKRQQLQGRPCRLYGHQPSYRQVLLAHQKTRMKSIACQMIRLLAVARALPAELAPESIKDSVSHVNEGFVCCQKQEIPEQWQVTPNTLPTKREDGIMQLGSRRGMCLARPKRAANVHCLAHGPHSALVTAIEQPGNNTVA